MIGTLKASWLKPLAAAVTLSVASTSFAQEGSWEDAPPTETQASGSAKADLNGQASAQATTQAQTDQQYNDRDPSALTDFSAELEPYGYWRDDPTYGRVWVPHARVVGPEFAPYVTSGHWALADD